MRPSFLVLHGWRGSPRPHWQAWLVDALRARRHNVAFPTLPNQDEPDRATWVRAIWEHLSGGPTVVVCHSLAVLAWLDCVARFAVPKAHRVLLVAPPGLDEIRPLKQTMRGFDRCVFDRAAVKRAAFDVRLVCSSADPWCTSGADKVYGKPLAIPTDVLHEDTGHINIDSDFGPWPQVLAWCLGERECITGRLLPIEPQKSTHRVA